MNMALYWRA